MKKFKKVFAGLMAVASLAVGMTGISASAASFDTQHVHVPGDGNSYSSEATFDYCESVKVVCTSVSSSNGSTSGCETRVKCVNNGYEMGTFNTVDTHYFYVDGMNYVPSVTYRLTAYTSVFGNTYRTKGNVYAN